MQVESIDIGCHGKEKFKTWKMANAVLKRTAHSQHNGNDKRKISIYTCKLCRSLHIGGSDHPHKK